MGFKELSICTLAFLAVGCNDTDGDDESAGIQVMAASGGNITLSGDYKTSCYLNNASGMNEQETHSFSTSSLTVSKSSWASNDQCATDVAVDYTIVFSATTAANIQITGWADGEGSDTVAPLGTNDSDLASDLTVTPLEVVVTSVTGQVDLAVGDSASTFYVVDNLNVSNGTNVYLYRDNDYDSGDTRATGVDRLSSD